MTTKLEWLFKMRVHYWEMRTPRERYVALRECKNRHPDFKGQYGMREVAKRLNLLNKTLANFEETGIPTDNAFLSQLLNDLGITTAIFNLNERPTPQNVASAVHNVVPATTLPPAQPPSPTVAAVKEKVAQAAPKREAKATGAPGFIVNHTHAPLIVGIRDGVIHVWEDTKSNARMGTWAPAVDEKYGGEKVEARKVPIDE